MQIERVIGHQIREFRKARGLKLEDLAKASKISKALLSKIENAKVGSPISTYSTIAAALGVNLGDLIQSEQEMGCIVIRKDERKLVSRKRSATRVSCRKTATASFSEWAELTRMRNFFTSWRVERTLIIA